MRRNRYAVLLLPALFWLGTPPLALPQPSERRAGAEITIESYAFPDAITGLARGRTHTFPGKGQGFAVNYARGDSWADIYVYDKGLDLSTPPSGLIEAEMKEVVQSVATAAKAGKYEEIKVDDASFGPDIASVALSVKAGGRPHLTFAFLTIAGGKFIKIRYSTSDMKMGRRQAEGFRDAAFARLRQGKPARRRGSDTI